ncbi:hypothetical protein DN069_38975 [Streptacidiphilus pinicola]|uniref:ATP/GTP-binding protein n=1 Tax=Streptacidiphilus pinicola TaxID=2219663 RepID=A0A2X0IRX6_9ACTN|nr:hypothetical protein [Streptacidiphilus pinicola]RAG80286.1 hypothetical protein DN069_38975 [Streptacidiphilus pinicola]
MLSGAPARARVWTRAGVILALVLGGLVGTSATAHADVSPCDNTYICIGVGSGGTPPGGSGGGGGGGGGGGSTCTFGKYLMPCYIPGIGWLGQDGCYYMEMQPQPPAGDPLWQGHQPGDGAVYVRTCALNAGGGTVTLWLAALPPMATQMTPGELAAVAAAAIPRNHPVIRSAPGDGQHGLVKAPVMLWIDGTGPNGYDDSWVPQNQPESKTASVPGLSVTATVWSTGVIWTRDDNQPLTTCDGPGTAFAPATGFVPGCSYTFGTAKDSYVISAKVTWHVHWTSSTGVQGDLAVDDVLSSNQITLSVKEIQVLN